MERRGGCGGSEVKILRNAGFTEALKDVAA
jgi:hypothetical protein